MKTIWSQRWSATRGWNWRAERECENAITSAHWLKIYQDDEPTVTFTLSKAKPRTNPRLGCKSATQELLDQVR